MDKLLICPKCDGYGYLRFSIEKHYLRYEIHKCSKCKGSGRLAIETISKTIAFIPDRNKNKTIY